MPELRRGAPVDPQEITVVICTSDARRWPLLQQAVASVRGQHPPPREVIVVVDRNLQLYRRACAELAGTRVISSSGEAGLAGARNAGVAVANGAVVAFLDDDAWAEPDWLRRLADAYGSDVLGVGGAVLPVWESRAPGWLPSEFFWTVGCSYTGLPEQRAAVRNPIGCNMSLRRSPFRKLGGFRPGLGRRDDNRAGCEETELCLRWARAAPSSRFVYEPAAVVHHTVGGNRTRWSYFIGRCYAEGRSKALMARLIGPAGLGPERKHAAHVVPAALLRELGALAHRRDVAAAARATALVVGLAAAGAGYLQGSAAGDVAN